jgi:hypothetical protein
MDAASLIGVGGVAMAMAWYLTPDFRVDDKDRESERKDDLEDLRDDMADVEDNCSPPPPMYGASESMGGISGQLPPSDLGGGDLPLHRRDPYQVSLSNSEVRVPKGRKSRKSRPTLHPDRNQACFEEYRLHSYRYHEHQIENPF